MRELANPSPLPEFCQVVGCIQCLSQNPACRADLIARHVDRVLVGIVAEVLATDGFGRYEMMDGYVGKACWSRQIC